MMLSAGAGQNSGRMRRGRGGAREVNAKRLAAWERQHSALDLRKAGCTYETIAAQLGYRGRQGAHAAVTRAMSTILRESVEDLRKLECLRLDAAQVAIWPGVLTGHLGNVDRFIRISESRRRLLGLDVIPKREMTTEEKIRVVFEELLAEVPSEGKEEIVQILERYRASRKCGTVADAAPWASTGPF